jgi:hypothetical protein
MGKFGEQEHVNIEHTDGTVDPICLRHEQLQRLVVINETKIRILAGDYATCDWN